MTLRHLTMFIAAALLLNPQTVLAKPVDLVRIAATVNREAITVYDVTLAQLFLPIETTTADHRSPTTATWEQALSSLVIDSLVAQEIDQLRLFPALEANAEAKAYAETLWKGVSASPGLLSRLDNEFGVTKDALLRLFSRKAAIASYLSTLAKRHDEADTHNRANTQQHKSSLQSYLEDLRARATVKVVLQNGP